MPYIATTDLEIGASFKKGDVISEDFLRKEQRSGWVLVNQGLAKYDPSAKPTIIAPKATETKATISKVEEVAPIITETGPVKATVEKHGVWFQVFANGKKLFNSRNEKEAQAFAQEFNANN